MIRILAFLAAAMLPLAVSASPSGSLTVAAINNTGCSILGSVNPNCSVGSGSSSVNNPGQSFASAQADLGSGSLAVSTATDAVFGHYASSLAEIWDTFAFSGVTAGQKATVTISGTAAIGGSSTLSYFADLIQAGYVTLPNGGNGELITLAASGAWSVSAQFPIANGTLDNGAYVLNAGLSATSELCGGDGCAGNIDATAVVTLTLPDNVTLTSDTGFGVPEPGTLSLLAMLPALAWIRRRGK